MTHSPVQAASVAPLRPSVQTGRTTTSSLAAALQRTYGNRMVQRMIANAVPVQRVWIVRGGIRVWEPDPYVLQPGETLYQPATFTQEPRVLINEGMEEIRFDTLGTATTSKRTAQPPTHPELQKKRTHQGKSHRTRLKRLKPDAIKKSTAELHSIADKLEPLAGPSVPPEHRKKVKKAHQGELTGPGFRKIIKAQDELTQSEATSAFNAGLRSRGGDTPPHYSQDLEDYAEATVRLSSALRIPTRSVVAPVTVGGSVTGQQHPTERSQPKLTGGSSGHSYADRGRVEAQNWTYEQLEQDPQAPPNALFLGSMLAAATTTLSTMSAPLSAENVPEFNKPGHERQRAERESTKKQTNVLANQLGLPVAESQQVFSAPWTRHETPTSPVRMDESETLEFLSKPKFTDKQIADFNDLHDYVSNVLQQLHAVLDQVAAPPQFTAQLIALWNALQHIDRDDAGQEAAVLNLYTQAHIWFISAQQYLGRRTVGTNSAADDPTGALGQRLPGLRQFFNECGQMAAHHVMTGFEVNTFENVNTLNQLGDFEENASEDAIRAMLDSANAAHIPVIGNLGQLTGQLLLAASMLGDDPEAWVLGEVEQLGLHWVKAFLAGEENLMYAVVNTTGHLDPTQLGTHWIAVRFEHLVDGQIGIQYMDSLEPDVHYSQLFAAYRQFFNT